MAYAEAMPLDWESGELAEGLACYGRGEFFAAHEHWESVWLTLAEPEKSFLQALIQITAARHHLQSGNSTGAASLLRRALRRLELSPANFGGIAVTRLCAEIREGLHAIDSGVAPATVPGIDIYPLDIVALRQLSISQS